MAQNSQASRHPGLWEFPGGKVEAGETEHQALARELFEELNVHIETQKRLCETRHQTGSRDLRMVSFLCRIVDIENLILFEHEQWGWFSLEQMKSLPMGELDKKVVLELASHF